MFILSADLGKKHIDNNNIAHIFFIWVMYFYFLLAQPSRGKNCNLHDNSNNLFNNISDVINGTTFLESIP